VDGKEIVRAGYNAMGAAYLATRAKDAEDVRLLGEFVRRLPKGARVLDAGCGPGVPVTRLLGRSFAVTGVDFSEVQLRLARQLVPEARFICQDMTELRFPDSYFDAICCLYAIIHVPREQHRELLRNFHRMLKPSGLALLCMGAGEWTGTDDDFLDTMMYWSHCDADTNVRLIQKCAFNIIWTRIVVDSLDPEAAHVFVLAQKKRTVSGGRLPTLARLCAA
jgi:SAM-dependent methyltransferase